MNKIKVCSAMLTRCEFTGDCCSGTYLYSQCLPVKPGTSPKSADASSSLLLYSLSIYQTQILGKRLQSGRLLFLTPQSKISHRIFGNKPSQIFFLNYATQLNILYQIVDVVRLAITFNSL